jgi:hypothetical protein
MLNIVEHCTLIVLRLNNTCIRFGCIYNSVIGCSIIKSKLTKSIDYVQMVAWKWTSLQSIIKVEYLHSILVKQ